MQLKNLEAEHKNNRNSQHAKFFQKFLQFLFLDQKELFVHVVETVFFLNPDLTIKSTCDSGKASRTVRTNPLDKTISPSQFGVRIRIFTGADSGI